MVLRQHPLTAAHGFLQPGFLSSHLQVFIQDLQHRGYTPLTIRGYADSICHFSQWARKHRLTLEDLDNEMLCRFSKHRCRCPGGRRHLWVSRKYAKRVRRFVHFLREAGLIAAVSPVPVASVPEFVARANQLVELLIPGARPVPFGHLGDGNIHYNASQPPGMERAIFLNYWEALNAAVHEIVLDLGGSISAEHGIGRLKRDLLPHAKEPVELELMRKIKAAFDPNNILNPGKLLP